MGEKGEREKGGEGERGEERRKGAGKEERRREEEACEGGSPLFEAPVVVDVRGRRPEEVKATQLKKKRTRVRPLPVEAKELVAAYTSLDILIWWHEEFDSPAVDRIISKRLESGECPTFTYGKLVEVWEREGRGRAERGKREGGRGGR
jgi:hypothetical protein